MNKPKGSKIGVCEWCGLIDHHLVDGECARCHARAEAPACTTPYVERRRDKQAHDERLAYAISRRVH